MNPETSEQGLDAVAAPLREEVRRAWEGLDESVCQVLESRGAVASRVWAASPFAASLCRRDPQLLLELIGSGDLERRYTGADMSRRLVLDDSEDEDAVMRVLRRVRRREMLRIVWRDISGAAGLDETLSDLSDLAECCVQRALIASEAMATRRFGVPRTRAGEPQRLAVLGMGKLGGRELNFSSDVDLLFVFRGSGQTDGRRALDSGEFFTRVGQGLIRLLAHGTEDGFVFRVDMRLRPFGSASPLAMSIEAMEDYYQSHGRNWERYALVKARVIAGERATGEHLLTRLRPFVYRRYLDFGAFEALREMKALINAEVHRKGLGDNIKLGAGGIRDVEFIGQAFQLTRGGRDRELQVRGTREVLRILGDKGLIPGYVRDRLLDAYALLRTVENRLQMMRDQQTHLLPVDDTERARIAFAMGESDWRTFSGRLEAVRLAVREEFDKVAAAPQIEDHGSLDAAFLEQLRHRVLDTEQAAVMLESLGFARPEDSATLLVRFAQGRNYRLAESVGRERMRRLIPLVLRAAACTTEPDTVLQRLLPVLESIAGRSVYTALLLEHPGALSHLVRLSEASPWIADFVARHPVVLDELLDARTLYATVDRQSLASMLCAELGQVDEGDQEEYLDRIRRFKHVQMLRVAAADVTGVLPVSQVSDQLTWVAEVLLEEIVTSTLAELVRRHGEPRCTHDGLERRVGFAVVAYGKLGSRELGYGSDLDIVFIHDSEGEKQQTRGGSPVENSVFFTRLAQRIIHRLTVFTPAGSLYEVDTRLRPSGRAGLLVSALHAFESYQQQDAWTWEHQALVRARCVAGSRTVADRFERVRHCILARPRDVRALRADVLEMRHRMWEELGSGESSQFHIKRDTGGMTDLEFVVQYLVLAHAARYPDLCEFTDNGRILEVVARYGLLHEGDADALRDIYRRFRSRVHALSLQGVDPVVGAGEFRAERELVARLWADVFAQVPVARDRE